MPAPDAPALVLGGHITGLAVVRALGRAGIPLYVAGADRRLVTRSRWYRPAPGAPPEQSEDGERLAGYLRGLPFERAVVFPCTDTWTNAVAALPADVAERFPSSVPPSAVVHALTDKEGFAAAAREHGMPIPRTYEVRGVGDLDAVGDDELASFFLKPRNSQIFSERYGRKGLPLSDRGEARDHVERLAADRVDMVLQEFIPGPATAHVFLDGYVDRAGVMRACLARRRLRMHPPELGNSTLSETIPAADAAQAEEDLRRLFAGLGFTGLFDAEFKYDHRDGLFKALEVNIRPWWQFEIAAAAGLPLGVMAYRDALGLPLDPAPDYHVGSTWVHPAPDVRAWWATRAQGAAGPSPVRAFFARGNAVFSPDDPRPAGEEAVRSLGRIVRLARESLDARRATRAGGAIERVRSVARPSSPPPPAAPCEPTVSGTSG